MLRSLAGTIERRVLVNYRVDPSIAATLLPAPLRPAVVNGHAVAGICIIQLKVRPTWAPRAIALRSINGAHRIAAVLPDGSPAVYVPRRDTNARINVLAGGRLFPGHQHLASITFGQRSEGSTTNIAIDLASHDDTTQVTVAGATAEHLPTASLFDSVREVSDFFEQGSLGLSDTSNSGTLEGIELRTNAWTVTPLEIHHAESSFFNDRAMFPAGSVELDNALLMRNIDHTWHRRASLSVSAI